MIVRVIEVLNRTVVDSHGRFLAVVVKSFFLGIGWSYLHDLSHTFLKRLKLL